MCPQAVGSSVHGLPPTKMMEGPPPRERKNAGAAQLARPQGKLRHEFPPRPAERRAAGGRRYCTDTLRLVRQRD